MIARDIDYGPYIGRLVQFGPPEVVPLADLAGNGTVAHAASGFWEEVLAVSLELAAGAAVANRQVRLSWLAGEATPFAQAAAAYAVTGSHTSQVTFAAGAQVAGAQDGPTIVTPIPALWLLPGWSLELDVLAGDAGDNLTGVRLYRVRYNLRELGEE